MAKVDVYALVTDKLIAKLETAGAWEKGWVGSASGLPRNWEGKAYNGANILMLWAAAMERGFSSDRWLTFAKAQELAVKAARDAGRNIEERKGSRGGSYYWDMDGDCFFRGGVRKGETGSHIVRVVTFDRSKGEKGEAAPALESGEVSVDRKGFAMVSHVVFNADQCDGLPAEYAPASDVGGVSESDRLELVDRLAESTGAAIVVGGVRACYSPSEDVVKMPEFSRFKSAAAYASTLVHELVHWSGKRLGRDLSGRFGSESYAMEELVAELGAAFVLASLGIAAEPRDDHAAYLASWLKVLKGDKRAVFSAARAASDAAALLLRSMPGAAVVESEESEAVAV